MIEKVGLFLSRYEYEYFGGPWEGGGIPAANGISRSSNMIPSKIGKLESRELVKISKQLKVEF